MKACCAKQTIDYLPIFQPCVGYLYEHSLGTMRFLAIGTFCAVLSLVIFLCIYRNAEGVIGGSVYIFALCGLGLTLQFLVPEFPKITLGTWSGNWLAIYLIASNIPLLSFVNITTVILYAIAFVKSMAELFAEIIFCYY